MLNPRVVNFKPAPTNLKFTKGYFNEQEDSIKQTIKNHFYNFSVSLILPDCMSVPEKISEIIYNDSVYYKMKSVPIHLFLTQDFIDTFIKGGEVCALSVNTFLDCDNCVSVTPNGQLILSIDHKTFQALGLIKGPAIDVRKNKNNFYDVIINLKTECFKIGSKNYDKAYGNLLNNSHFKFDVIACWEPTDEAVCPSSMASFFVRHGIEVTECELQVSKRIHYSVKYPLFEADMDELVEWFGALALNCISAENEGSSDFMVFEAPEPYEEIGQVVFSTWAGFISCKRIQAFFEALKKLASEKKDCPWIGFCVLGFLDSPVAWGLSSHSFRISGENDFTVLMKSDEEFILCKNTETYKLK